MERKQNSKRTAKQTIIMTQDTLRTYGSGLGIQNFRFCIGSCILEALDEFESAKAKAFKVASVLGVSTIELLSR